MKLNTIPSLIAIGISALLAYAFFSFNDNNLKVLLSIGSFVTLGLTLLMCIGARFHNYRSSITLRTASATFFSMFLISNVLFSFIDFSVAAYVVINGVIFLIYLLILYYLFRLTS